MTSDRPERKTFLSNNWTLRSKLSFLLIAVLGIVLTPIGFILLSQPTTVIAQQQTEVPDTENGQQQPMGEEQFMPATVAAIDMNSSKIIVSGTAASPGDEAGPFQIVPILPERMDGRIYVGSISFTASAPIYVVPGYGFDSQNQMLNHKDFGELIRFPSEASFANNTLAPPEIAHGPIMPQYGEPLTESGIGMLPSVYSASVPFIGDLLEVGNVNGTRFLISYTVIADVYDTVRVSDLGPAVLNTTGQGPAENHVSIVYGSVELTTDAHSPNPITINAGENVTWSNDDFLPHTVTSGTPEQMATDEAGQEFDSGFIGTRSSFTHTFEDSGEFEYFCELHPNMVGTVVVR
jgi:plastocyanin